MEVLRRIINRIRSRGRRRSTGYERSTLRLDVVEVQSSIIADLAEVNRLLLEELETKGAWKTKTSSY